MKKIEDFRAAISFDVSGEVTKQPALPIGSMPTATDEALQGGAGATNAIFSSVVATPASVHPHHRHSSFSVSPPALAGIASPSHRDSMAMLNSSVYTSSAFESGGSTSSSVHCTWRNTAVLSLGGLVFVAHGGLLDNSCLIRCLVGSKKIFALLSIAINYMPAASGDSKYLVTGGRDTTFIVDNVVQNRGANHGVLHWRARTRTQCCEHLQCARCRGDCQP